MGKYDYAVLRSLHGGQRTMLRTASYKRATSYYAKHPKAFGIQRYVRGTYTTAGLLQPHHPSKISFRGKQYSQVYVGPHTRKFAKSVVREFRKKGMPSQAKKYKRGWYIYARR